MSFSERDLGKAFKKELEKRYIVADEGYGLKPHQTTFRVYLNKPVPTKSGKFKRFWRSLNLENEDIPPPQPEIDMILIDDSETMRAVELKLIKKTRKGIRPSYYEGLDQALAYLSFGFHQVALWLCFDGNTLTDKEIHEYNDAFEMIRASIYRLVDATFFRVTTNSGHLHIETELFNQQRVPPRWWQIGIGIPTNASYNLIKWTSMNPFMMNSYFPKDERWETTMKKVKAIHEFMKGQRKIWDKTDLNT